MTIYYILLGILLCSIIMTSAQIKADRKRDLNELMNLFEDNIDS